MFRNTMFTVIAAFVLVFSSFTTPSTVTKAATKEALISIENKHIEDGGDIDLNDHVDALSALDEGSIVVRYHTDSNDLMSLFSLSNNNEPNTYFSLYVYGGKVGSENRTAGKGDIHLVKDTPLLKTNEVHTVVMTADQEAGYTFFVDGEKVHEDTNAEVAFLSNIAGANQAHLGRTARSGGNEYNFSGDIDFAEIYAEPLTEEEAIDISAATYSEKVESVVPEGVEISKPQDIFYSGFMDSVGYRIPALLYTKQGTLIAGIDRRVPGGWDSPNDIDSMIRRSHDNGDTWEEEGIIVKSYPKNGSNIDMAMVQDEDSERIFLLVTTFPDGAGLMGGNSLKGTGYKEIDGNKYLMLRDSQKDDFEYTVREDGVVYDDATNEPTAYVVDQGRDLYENGEKIDNIFSETTPLKPYKSSYLELYHSDDEGETWSDPIDINAETKEEYMSFLGTGPGNGIQITRGEHEGRIVFPVYFFNDSGRQASAVVYSDDLGETWERGESPNEGRDVGDGNIIHEKDFTDTAHELTEAQVVEMPNGQLKMFMRNYSGYARVATSVDGGETWLPVVEMDEALTAPYSQMTAIRYDGQIDGKEAIIFASASNSNARVDGAVRVGLIDEDGTYENGETKYKLDWKYEQLVKEGHYGYSNLANIKDGKIGLHYEGTDNTDMSFIKFNVDFLKWDKAVDTPGVDVTDVTLHTDGETVEAGDEIGVTVTFGHYTMMNGVKELQGTFGDEDITFTLKEQKNDSEFTFTAEVPQLDDGEHELAFGFAKDLRIYNQYGSKLDIEAFARTKTLRIGEEEGEETPDPEEPTIPEWMVGEGEPKAEEGNAGDLYLDSLTGDIYKKDDDGWTYVANIQGADGEDGSDGEDGEDGATWIVGKGEPSADQGKTNDLYVDSETGKVYEKTADGWTYVTTLAVETDPCDCDEDEEQDEDGKEGPSKPENNGSKDDDSKDEQEVTPGTGSDNTGSGKELPNTATQAFNLLLAGFIILLIGGGFLFFKRKQARQ